MIGSDGAASIPISVVIPTWNSDRYIGVCLDSLAGQPCRPAEVIVVDNGSTDRTVSLARRRWPSLVVIQNAGNLGFCRAANQGIRAAASPWVLLLNSDTELAAGTLAAFAAAASRAEASVGMIGGKLLRMDRRTIDSTGLLVTRARRFYDRGGGEIDHGQCEAPCEILGPCGAAALYRRDMLEAIAEDGQFFDERFFALVDDVDLALRARRAGWRAWYEPTAIVYHARNGSGLSRRVRQYLSVRNRYYLLFKHETARSLWRDAPYLAAYEAARLPWLLLTNRLTWRALREALSNGPKMRQCRNQMPDSSCQ